MKTMIFLKKEKVYEPLASSSLRSIFSAKRSTGVDSKYHPCKFVPKGIKYYSRPHIEFQKSRRIFF